MQNKELHQQYADLLPAGADQAAAQVVRDLHTMYATAPAPAHLDTTIARAVQQRAVEQAQRPAQRHTIFGGFGGWQLRTVGVVAALLLAMVAGGAYAIIPVLNQAFTQLGDKGLQEVDVAGLMHDVDLQQTVHGYTVDLQRVYADANRVMVGFTVRGPDQDVLGFQPNEMYLRTADGVDLPMDLRLGLAKNDGGQGNIYMFDADTIQSSTADISLRFEIHNLLVYGKDATRGEESATTIAGPFTFDFIVPFVAGHVVEVNQTVMTNGVPVTLDRVVITPSMTHAYLRLYDTNHIPARELLATTRVVGEGWDVNGDSVWTEDDGQQRIAFQEALFDKHGEWTLIVDELRGATPEVQSAAVVKNEPWTTEQIEGPWEFRFVVP
jgi:hypothetical protein